MLSAIAVAMVLMIALAQGIQRLIERHPTLKMLALAFLLLIGFTLVGEGAGLHIPKGYIYFAMLFSLGVEGLNIWAGLRAGEKNSS
jgi:predicted tellurium resistance membrane protein TerC